MEIDEIYNELYLDAVRSYKNDLWQKFISEIDIETIFATYKDLKQNNLVGVSWNDYLSNVFNDWVNEIRGD